MAMPLGRRKSLGNGDTVLLAVGPDAILSFFCSDGLITSVQLVMNPSRNLLELFLSWALPFFNKGKAEGLWLLEKSDSGGSGNEGSESGEFHLCFVLFINYKFCVTAALNMQILDKLNIGVVINLTTNYYK